MKQFSATDAVEEIGRLRCENAEHLRSVVVFLNRDVIRAYCTLRNCITVIAVREAIVAEVMTR